MRVKLLVVGAGGHAKVLWSVAVSLGYEVVCFLDCDPCKWGSTLFGVPVEPEERKSLYLEMGVRAAGIGVGSVGDVSARKRIFFELKSMGFELPPLVSPRAYVAPDVELGEGTLVVHGAVVNPGTRIGSCVIVNTCASVDHDCRIGDFVHLAPGSVLSGGVVVEDEAHVGTGACAIQGVRIGRGAVVGAGATVVCDLPPGVVAKGVPARW